MSSFSRIFHDVRGRGKLTSPRSQKTLECLNYTSVFEPYERFANFPSRRLSLSYIKDETLWYLKGDKRDLSIADKAKLWHEMVTNGQLNSQYGAYIFKENLIDYVVDCLTKDPDSRRAIITILNSSHLYMGNKDVPCTVSLGFRIRDNELQCTVHMRSSDLIFGYANDVPFFSLVQEMVLVLLNDVLTQPASMGTLTIFSESLHVYERHWPMLEKLLIETVVPVNCPKIRSRHEINMLRMGQLPMDLAPYPFTQWLHTRD